MSNRDDFRELSRELAEMFGWDETARVRVETELHDAYVAGQESVEEPDPDWTTLR